MRSGKSRAPRVSSSTSSSSRMPAETTRNSAGARPWGYSARHKALETSLGRTAIMIDCAPCATRTPSAHVYYSMTKGLCSTCKRPVDVKIHFRDDAVSFIAPNTPPTDARPVKNGCPFDCGPCKSHQQKVYMPVVPITSACNLDCPICYTVNKNENAHMLSEEAFQKTLDHLTAQHDELDIINF